MYVGPSNETCTARHCQLCLKRKRRVTGFIGGNLPMIDKEDGHTLARSTVCFGIFHPHQTASSHTDSHAVAAGNWNIRSPSFFVFDGNGERLLLRLPQPGIWLIRFRFQRLIVTPFQFGSCSNG